MYRIRGARIALISVILPVSLAIAFFLDRYKAGKGMTCSGYTDQGQKMKLKITANSRVFAKGARPVGEPDVAMVGFAGCLRNV